MTELSHKQIVEGLCAVAHRVILAFDTAKNPDTVQLSFGDLEPEEQDIMRDRVHRCLRMLHHDAADIHANEIESLEEKGWKRGFSHDPGAKTSPMIRPYDELPVGDRQRYAVFVEVIHACYE
jgi:hypothetical protein